MNSLEEVAVCLESMLLSLRFVSPALEVWGEGNIFYTCLSVHRGSAYWRGLSLKGVGWRLHFRGLNPPPPPRHDTIGSTVRAVRILLEVHTCSFNARFYLRSYIRSESAASHTVELSPESHCQVRASQKNSVPAGTSSGSARIDIGLLAAINTSGVHCEVPGRVHSCRWLPRMRHAHAETYVPATDLLVVGRYFHQVYVYPVVEHSLVYLLQIGSSCTQWSRFLHSRATLSRRHHPSCKQCAGGKYIYLEWIIGVLFIYPLKNPLDSITAQPLMKVIVQKHFCDLICFITIEVTGPPSRGIEIF